MSYTFDQNVIAAARVNEQRKNTRALILAIVAVIIILAAAITAYLVIKARNKRINDEANS